MITFGIVQHRGILTIDIRVALMRIIHAIFLCTIVLKVSAEEWRGLTFEEMSLAVDQLPLERQQNIWEVTSRQVLHSPADWQKQFLVLYRPTREGDVCILEATSFSRKPNATEWSTKFEVMYKKAEPREDCARDYTSIEEYTTTFGGITPGEFSQAISVLRAHRQAIQEVLPEMEEDVGSSIVVLSAFEDSAGSGVAATVRGGRCEVVVALRHSNDRLGWCANGIGDKLCGR